MIMMLCDGSIVRCMDLSRYFWCPTGWCPCTERTAPFHRHEHRRCSCRCLFLWMDGIDLMGDGQSMIF